MDLHRTMFYCCLASLVLAIGLGIAGIWVPEEWRSNTGWKLFVTSWVLFAGTGISTLLIKWLQ